MTANEMSGLQQLSQALAAAVETAGAATVSVFARRRQPASGIAFEGGVIVTADHVIEQDEEIAIATTDGKRVPAKLVGRDPSTDVAVLRPDGVSLSAARAAEQPRVGNIVLAVGRPGSEGPVVSFGVVSSISGPVRTRRGGQLEGFIRTDAEMYPGFSGGPLIDVAGRVVGMNTSGLSRMSALAIPYATLTRVAATLVQHGRIRRGFLGITSQPVRLSEAQSGALGGQKTGLLIVGTEANGPADKGGLLVGDILVALGGEKVEDTDDLQRLLGGDRIGQATPVRVLRGGEQRDLSVTVG
ncbi:MAG TPA: trypsin-like peptidase domain-containing protein, partial [Dehalococcoidia bacterium]|nr:trypsin-like peptidase domain-containing protein [Dehalococcoidia bacterium]